MLDFEFQAFTDGCRGAGLYHCDDRLFFHKDNVTARAFCANCRRKGVEKDGYVKNLAMFPGKWIRESNSTVLVKSQPTTVDELRSKLLPFCEKHAVQKLEVFGSVAEGITRAGVTPI